MLKDILSISGQTGLYKLVLQAKNSIIVESLIDEKRMPVYASTKISALEDISIYTIDGDLKLAEILIKIFENKISVDSKISADSLKKQFKEILPNYDENRVYVSDIKKIFSWFNLLTEKEIITEETIKFYKESIEEAEREKENKIDNNQEIEEKRNNSEEDSESSSE